MPTFLGDVVDRGFAVADTKGRSCGRGRVEVQEDVEVTEHFLELEHPVMLVPPRFSSEGLCELEVPQAVEVITFRGVAPALRGSFGIRVDQEHGAVRGFDLSPLERR